MSGAETREPAIELEGVSVRREGRRLLEDVSLRVAPREYLAILGPNGGGKTTLLRVILGLERPERGRVRVLGGPPERARGRVGYVPQRVHFDLDFPIRVVDVVRMGRLARRRLGRRLTERDGRAVREAMERVEIAALAERALGGLSGGELQRVLLARALALEPEILLLDEPTASLDERLGRDVWTLLGELSREVTLVLVSHDVGAIARSVQSIACLNRRLFAHPAHALTREVLEKTYGSPVELVAHDVPHRVLHEPEDAEPGRGGP